MPTPKHEFPTRSLEGDAVTHSLAVGAVLALQIPGKVWRKVKQYAEKPPKDSKRDKLIGLYGDWIAHIYNALILDGLARTTIFCYTVIFGKFICWADNQGYTELSDATVKAFLDHHVEESRERSKKRYGKSSDPEGRGMRRTAFFAIRKIADELMKLDLTRDMPIPPRPEPIPAASEETVQTLAEDLEIEDYVFLLFIINCLGLRPGVAVALTWDNFDSDFRCVRFNTAYGEKSVDIDGPCQQVLKEYRRRTRDGATPLLQRCNHDAPRAVTVRTLEYRLERLAKACGIEEHLTLTALQKAWPVLPALLERLIRTAA